MILEQKVYEKMFSRMEKVSDVSKDNEETMELPPGFRFHPSDEELISHYLSPKVLDNSFCAITIGEVDLNKVEPWDLPWKAKMGEKEWYFFCVRDRKYPTGMRTNRATDSGYWKATGKDKEIFKAQTLVGMKKTLVFYKGRAPRGEKTNWVMHEYRLDGNNSMHNLPNTAKSEWVICRIFKKTSGGKKIHISGLVRTCTNHSDAQCSNLPPLMDISSYESHTRASLAQTSHVPCFSNKKEEQKPEAVMINNSVFENTSINYPKPSNPISLASSQITPFLESFHYMDSAWTPDHSILKLLLENDASGLKQNGKETEYSQDAGMRTDMSSSVSNHEAGSMMPYENQGFTITSAGPIDIDCLCDY